MKHAWVTSQKLHKKHKVVERIWNDGCADSRFKYLDAGSGWKS